MLRNEKGNALVLTVVILAVVMMFAMTMMFVGESSFKHADKEQKKTQAYYVAKTGAESVIKHLEDKGNAGDMRDELEELIEKTDLKEFGKGKYKEGDFEIEVKKETRNGKRVYLVKSTGEIEHGNNEGKDQITAVLTPDYEASKIWGQGVIDAGGKDVLEIDNLGQLDGPGMIINLDEEKVLGGQSPVIIHKGGNGKQITNLFGENPDGKLVLNGYTLGKRNDKKPNILSETLMEVNPTGTNSKEVEFNYGVPRNKPNLSFPTGYGAAVKREDLTIDVNNPTIGKLVTEPYDVIEFVTKKQEREKEIKGENGEYLKEDDTYIEKKNKKHLKINADVFELKGKNTIVTSEDVDVIIRTSKFFLNEFSELNIKGNGKVYIYSTGSFDLHQYSKVGIDLDLNLKPEDQPVNTNIHFYAEEDTNIGFEDGSQASNTFIYAPRSRFTMDDKALFTGKISVRAIGITDEATIRSPAYGVPDEDKAPIIGFKKIEWER